VINGRSLRGERSLSVCGGLPEARSQLLLGEAYQYAGDCQDLLNEESPWEAIET
jgi:hypothetical protein